MYKYVCRKTNLSKIILFLKSLLENYEISVGSFRTYAKSIFPKLVHFQGKPSLKTSFKENFDFNTFGFIETYYSPSPMHPVAM